MSNPRLIRPFDLLLDQLSGFRLLELTDTVVETGRLQLKRSTEPPGLAEDGDFRGLTLPKGVAVLEGNLFIADPENGRILQWTPCAGLTPLPQIGAEEDGARQVIRPEGLAFDSRGDLLVVDSESCRVLVFSYPGWALRQVLGPFPSRASDPAPPPDPPPSQDPCELDIPAGEGQPVWKPVDVATSGCSVFVADAEGYIWRFDSRWNQDSTYQGVLGNDLTPRRIVADHLGRTFIAIEDDPSRIILLDSRGKPFTAPNGMEEAVHSWLNARIPELTEERLATFEEESEARAALLPFELSHLIDEHLNRYITDLSTRHSGRTRDQLWQMELRPLFYAPQPSEEGEPHLGTLYQLSLESFFGSLFREERLRVAGRALELRRCGHWVPLAGLSVDAEGRLDVSGQHPGPYLSRPPSADVFVGSGVARLEPLDSGVRENPWHRIALDMEAPERTGVRLFSFTSEVLRPDLAAVDEGTDLLAEPPVTGPWQASPGNASEWLIQSPPGRFLYLTIVLKGPGNLTPGVERIYVYKRRDSSLKYLPAPFHSDETGRRVLDRLLSMTDTMLGEIESAIEDFPRHLDILGAPSGFLPWLASWFDLQLLPVWDEDQKRRFLGDILELYRWRGTVRGLRHLLRLHTRLPEGAALPRIIESYRALRNPMLAHWLSLSPAQIDSKHFTVVLPSWALDSDEKRTLLHRLIDKSKPAHTRYTLRGLSQPGQLGSGFSVTDADLTDWRLPPERAENARAVRPAAIGVDSHLIGSRDWTLPPDAHSSMSGSLLRNLPPDRRPKGLAVQLGRTRLGYSVRASRPTSPCGRQGECSNES